MGTQIFDSQIKDSIALTGTPTAPTPSVSDDSTRIATTAYVKDVLSTSPVLTGIPTAPTASPGTNTTQIATTAYVDAGLALKADIDPIVTYTHTANKEAHCTAVDISTNVFTSNSHTLVDGDMVWAIANEDAGPIIPRNIYPGGITHMAYPGYYVGVVDANSFKLYTDIARTTEVDITANANMDLSKMHFETIHDEIKITGLNAYKYRVVVNGKCLRDDIVIKDGSGGAIGINNAWTEGVIGDNNAGNNNAATVGGGGDIFFEGVFDLDSTKTAKIKVHTHTITTNDLITNKVITSTKDTVYFKQSIYNTPITSIIFSFCCFANGTKIEVYKA